VSKKLKIKKTEVGDEICVSNGLGKGLLGEGLG
jgi:hypothetical protein